MKGDFKKIILFAWLRWVSVAACGPSLVGAHRVLTEVASLVVQHGL